ncbi:MAG TPA: orotidine-5'-phosphate decarboxylase [Pyrinomonadaceae bacterium]|nr:orotidine-5'-phosphate decarboxylase [Pyrinomonadaceae bacterium]
MKPGRNKLIVALDVETSAEARRIVSALRGMVGMFKIGSQLYTSTGPELVREIVAMQEQVFLDLKFHDIPNTVAAAAVEATRLGVSLFNVHAAGGTEMMRRTADAVSEFVAKERLAAPAIIAVTVLTSSNADTLAELGITDNPEEMVTRLALLTEASGLDGVVASPREVERVRAAVKKPGFLIVTPGIRPAGSDPGDQKRVMTPREAIRAGSDYIVIGRPILMAHDAVRAVQSILDDLESVPA